jgi:hypothetical protein
VGTAGDGERRPVFKKSHESGEKPALTVCLNSGENSQAKLRFNVLGGTVRTLLVALLPPEPLEDVYSYGVTDLSSRLTRRRDTNDGKEVSGAGKRSRPS